MTIELTDVIEFHRNLPHQKKAIAYLQANIPEDTLTKFADLWRVMNQKTPLSAKWEQEAIREISLIASCLCIGKFQNPIALRDELLNLADRVCGEGKTLRMQTPDPDDCWEENSL